MDENTMKQIAEILGVSADSISAMDEEIKSSMMALFEQVAVKNDEDKKAVFEALNNLWIKGMIESNLREIADHTGIDLTTMQNLDEKTKHMLVFEYAMDSTNIYELIHSTLSVSELPKIARLLGVELSVLTALSPDTQRKICGHFAMMYEENGDNSVLFHELQTMME